MRVHEARIYPRGWPGVSEVPCIMVQLAESIGPQPFAWMKAMPAELDLRTTAEMAAWMATEITEGTEFYWLNQGKLPSEWKKVVFQQCEQAKLSGESA